MVVASWQSIEQRTASVPAAARPFPYEASAHERWSALFDWDDDDDDDEATAEPWAGAQSVPLQPVQPVWQLAPINGEAPTPAEESRRLYTLRSMPSYDQCFMGLC